MSITINAKGTTVPHFTIGKFGTTLYQGMSDPAESYNTRPGDYWMNNQYNSLHVWSNITNAWEAPKLADIKFTNNTISTDNTDLILKTDGLNSKVIFAGDVGPGIITASASQDLYIDPRIGGGRDLIINDNKWPTTDGLAGQVISTNGAGVLGWEDIVTPPLRLYTENTALDSNSIATGDNSIAIGHDGNSHSYGMVSYSSGKFSDNGDAQCGIYTVRNITTNYVPTELYLDGISIPLILPINSVVCFSIVVSARQINSSGRAGFQFNGVAQRDITASSASFVSTPSKITLGNSTFCDVSIEVNTTTGALSVIVVGETGVTMRWVAVISTTEVSG